MLTNNRSYLLKNFKKPKNFFIKEIKFKTVVPKKINFYSSHFKIDVFHFLSKLRKYSFLIDLDIVLINEKKISQLSNYKSKNVIGLYDRTYETIKSYKLDKIKSDIEFLAGKKINNIKWFGGEFYSGNPLFFKKLYKGCSAIKKKYFENYSRFFHNGDEMITNIFFNANPTLKYKDMGNNKIIYRYWNNITFHKQKNFKTIKKYAFLHLPADKKTLANISLKNMTAEEFIHFYENKTQNYRRKFYLYCKKQLKKFIKF